MREFLYRFTPKAFLNILPRMMRERLRLDHQFESLPSYKYLRDLMERYQTKNLINVRKGFFRKELGKLLSLRDWEREGYASPEKQSPYYIDFTWGHNHDFGEFRLGGRMRNRHLWLPAVFIDKFNILPKSLDGLRILDIGPWTGGTSLLFAAMGAQVVAVEEVKKYADTISYLKYAFDITNLEVKNLSLYDCTTEEFQDSFDFVFFCGVLYHVTDPILALRILFNSLKDGGHLLLETLGTNSRRNILSYRIPAGILRKPYFEDPKRKVWDWFIPSPSTVSQTLSDVGYKDVSVTKVMSRRIFATARRDQHVDMNRSGLSKRFIR